MRRLACLLMILTPGVVLGGAWTQPVGRVFLSGAASIFHNDDGGFTQAESSVYAELGLIDWLTIGATLERRAPVLKAADIPGELEAGVFLRARADTFSKGDPLSFQIGMLSQIGRYDPVALSADLFSGLEFGFEKTALDARLLYGRGFETALGSAWFDFQIGPRLHFDAAADEFRIDATFGLRPAENWLLMAQSFTTLSIGNADYFMDDRSDAKLAASIGYQLSDDMTLVLSAERQIWGLRTDPGTRVKLGIWRSFDLF